MRSRRRIWREQTRAWYCVVGTLSVLLLLLAPVLSHPAMVVISLLGRRNVVVISLLGLLILVVVLLIRLVVFLWRRARSRLPCERR
jgi:hypothetical protein